jgi:hypothetical protein
LDVRNVFAVSHIEHLWRCCKRTKILKKNKCEESIETLLFWGGVGRGEKDKKVVGGDEKWHQNNWKFSGQF